MRWLVPLLVCVALAALGLLIHSGTLVVPPRWNPWAPLAIDEPPNWLTSWRLRRLSNDAELCRSVLTQAEMRYESLPDRATGPGCGFSNAVRVEETSAEVGEPFALSCRSAVSLALWERHVLQPQALAHFGTPVRRIEHFGSYACRNVYGQPDRRRSQHASADALDIAGFVLADGRRIRVLGDWDGDGPHAQFLRDLHAGACRFFDGVLGPDYNAAHRDHFHIDRGEFRVCR